MSDISPNGGPIAAPVEAPLTLAPMVAEAPEKAAARKRLEVRVWSVFVFVMCASMLGIGFWLRPNNGGQIGGPVAGVGTHQQLGLPPCGFMQATGIPCPTCGATTAVSNFSHGHFVTSLLTQPFGFAVALTAAMLLPLTLIGAMTGSWRGPSMFWLGWHWRSWVFGGLAILVLGWIYKIMIVRQGITF